MPIPIPRADEAKGLGTPQAVSVPDTGATSVADAISRLGSTGAKLAEHMLQQRTQMQSDAYVSNAISNYQQEYLNKTQELEKFYSDKDGIGLHKDIMDWDKAKRDELRKSAPTAIAQNGFDQAVSKLSTSALINADTTEQKQFTTYHTKKIDEHLKDLTNSIPLFKDQIVEKTESSFLSYADSLHLAEKMGLITAEDVKNRENLGGAQFAISAGQNASEQGDFTAVARIIGGGERFVPMALAYMDKYYPPGTKENNNARAYMMKKIRSSGESVNASRLEKFLTAEQKEALIRNTLQSMKVTSETESSDLNERIKEMNAKLRKGGIPTDPETVQQLGGLNSEINGHEKFSDFQKLNRTMGFHIQMAGGEMEKTVKVLPEARGKEIINQFRSLDFSNPAKQKEAEAFMTQMGFTPETKALFIKNPTIASVAIKEITADLARKHNSFWNDMNRDSGNTAYNEIEGIGKQWDAAMGTWNITGDTSDAILSTKEFQKAIIMTKMYEADMGIPTGKATTIPTGIAGAMIADINALYEQGNYKQADIALDALKSVFSLKDQYPGMFNNIETRLVKANEDDFFTAKTTFVMRLPSGREREQLLKNSSKQGQDFIEAQRKKAGFSHEVFSEQLTTSPEWRSFTANMSRDMYSAVKAESLRQLLTDELIRTSTMEQGEILKTEKAADITELVKPKHIQKVMSNYIDKNYTVYASGGARITIDNGVINDAIKQWPEADQQLVKGAKFKESLMLATELTARDWALHDPDMVVPQAFLDKAKSRVAAGKGAFFGSDVGTRLDSPQYVKQLFLDKAVMFADGTDGFIFKVDEDVLLDSKGQPYKIRTDHILNSDILKDYVINGTEKSPLFNFFSKTKFEKMQARTKEIGKEIKKEEEKKNKDILEQQTNENTALEERLDL